MPETIGDILAGGGFTEAVKDAITQATTEPVKTTEQAGEPVKTVEPVTSGEPVKAVEPANTQEPVSDPAVEFYKRFGLEGEEQLKSSLNELESFRKTKSDFESKETYFNELERQFEEMVKQTDQSSLFSSEDEYKNFLIAQKIGQGKDFGVVQKIIRTDLGKLDDLDVLSLKDQFDIPKYAGRDEMIKRAILEGIGVDVGSDDFKVDQYREHITPEQELKLARLANDARNFFNVNKSDVKIPDKIDYKQKIQERIQQRQERVTQTAKAWEEISKKIVDTASQIKVFDRNEKGEEVVDFVYDVDAEFKKEIPEIATTYAVNNNLEPTPENVKAVNDLLLNAYWAENKDKIVRAYKNEALTKLREQLDKERYNGQPINKTEAPPDRKPDDNDEINLIAGKLFK